MLGEKISLNPFANISGLELLYSERWHDAGDSPVFIYTTQKLSILLTDDLAGVIGNNVYNTVRGDFFVFGTDEIHFGRFLKKGFFRYFDVYLPADYFDEPGFTPAAQTSRKYMEMFTDRGKDRVNLVDPDENARADILRICERLAAMVSERGVTENAPDELLMFSLTIELLDICYKAYSLQRGHPVKSCAPSVVSKLLGYMNERYSEPIDLATLSAYTGCSVTYLTRTFRRHTGKTIHGYLNEIRVKEAEKRLLSGSTVTEACYASGFSDCSNFIKIFRKYAGTTPGRLTKRERFDDLRR